MKQSNLTILFSCITLLGLSACNNTRPMSHAHTPAHPTQNVNYHTDAKKHEHKATWHYDNNGAESWGEISGFETCKTGQEQSPIDIAKVMLSDDKAPMTHFNPSDMEVVNNGHTIVYTPKNDTNKTLIGGESYTLKQFHYHTPSEHQISGTNYPAELHFVHANSEGNLAVIGVMLTPTSSVDKLSTLTSSANSATYSTHPVMVSNLDLDGLIPSDTAFYSYAGSLTTPPCSENVKWFVMEKPLSVSYQDLTSLETLYKGNNRPVQPLGERTIEQVE